MKCPGSLPIMVLQGSQRPSSSPCSLTGREILTPFPGLGTAAAPVQGGAHLEQCDLLKLSRRQKQLCRREPGLAETLQDAARLGLLECQFQFRQERWNCSLEGRTGLLKRGGTRDCLPACLPARPSIAPTQGALGLPVCAQVWGSRELGRPKKGRDTSPFPRIPLMRLQVLAPSFCLLHAHAHTCLSTHAYTHMKQGARTHVGAPATWQL